MQGGMSALSDLRLARLQAHARVDASGAEGARATMTALAVLGVLLVGYLIFLTLRRSGPLWPWLDGWLVAYRHGRQQHRRANVAPCSASRVAKWR
jgi:hypothetical protein